MMRYALFLTATLACSAASQAQDVSIYGGLLHVADKSDNSFAAALAYVHPVGDNFALSLGYLNEGHPRDHHRDGLSGQLWLRTHRAEAGGPPGWTFGAGVGRYYFFDTANLGGADGANYHNDHGWAHIVSLQATWHYSSRWYNQVQLNRVVPSGKDATTTLLVGVGYRFDGVRGDKLHLDGPSTDDTLTAMAGQGISNSFMSERSRTSAIEYRRALGHYVDWTVTAIQEGGSPQTRRNGVASQLWLIRSLAPEVELGMGAGPYLNARVPEAQGQRSHKSALVTIASRYHFSKRVVGELSWNRVVTDYHRDADLLLLGLGYSF